MDLQLQGKVAIVTGGSKGIGRAIAEELAAEGANLVLCARNKQALEELASRLRLDHNVAVLPIAIDLSIADSSRKIVAQTIQHYGRIDILVNNAGAVRQGAIADLTAENMLEDWSLKVFGYYRMVQEVFPLMKKQSGGQIVNIAGITGSQPRPSYLAGGMGNAALMNLTKALAAEGGPFRIRVNAINPGPVATDRLRNIIGEQAARRGVSVLESEKLMMRDVPLGRAANPREIAKVVAFLVSEQSSFITGAVIPVDGGAARGL